MLFGCPPPPALIFENRKKVFTVQKYTTPNFRIPKKGFFFENFDLLKIFFSCCFNTGFKLV